MKDEDIENIIFFFVIFYLLMPFIIVLAGYISIINVNIGKYFFTSLLIFGSISAFMKILRELIIPVIKELSKPLDHQGN